MENEQILQEVITYVEETLRNSSRGSIEYIDFKNQKNRINTRQNHIIYGRRGAGKTSLLNVVEKKQGIFKYINMEDFKDIDLSNIVIQVLINLYNSLNSNYKKFGILEFKKKYLKYKLNLKVKNQIIKLNMKLNEPNFYDITEKSKGSNQKTIEGEGSLNILEKITTKGKATWTKDKQIEKTTSYHEEKFEVLKGSLGVYKSLLNMYEELYDIKYIYLILDDFYFIPKNSQYKFIDFFHRITKDTCLFLKIASIKYRTRLFLEEGGTYVGTQLNHDIIPIELDYTLENFNMLKDFMKEILTQINKKFNAQFIFEYFSDNGYIQLYLASGGVPRDLLVLYSYLLNKVLSKEITTIGKVEVTDAAINKIDSKIDAIKTDVSDGNAQQVEHVFEYIRNQAVNINKCNMFLISKEEANAFQKEHSYIKELMDLRLIHIVNSKTSCAPSDGKMYEAYMIDIGLYPNSKPQKFKQIDLTYKDSEGRKDAIRSCPKVSLASIRQYLSEKEVAIE